MYNNLLTKRFIQLVGDWQTSPRYYCLLCKVCAAEKSINKQNLSIMENEMTKGTGWGLTTALWVVVGVIVFGILFWAWSKMNTEKTEVAVALANVVGRVNAIEPAVTNQGNSIADLNSVISATTQGVKDMKESFSNQLYELNDEIFYNPGRRGRGSCGCGGNREFRQTSTYNLASTNVTVDETCRN